MSDKPVTTKQVISKNLDFVRSELALSLDLYKSQLSLATQVITVIVVGDITLTGYALSSLSAGILLVGALFPLMALYQLYRFNKMIKPVIYTAINLELKYGNRDTDWLMSTLMATSVSLNLVNNISKISEEPNLDNRIEKLNKMKINSMGGGKGLVRAGLIFATIAQLIAPIILTLVFKWKLF